MIYDSVVFKGARFCGTYRESADKRQAHIGRNLFMEYDQGSFRMRARAEGMQVTLDADTLNKEKPGRNLFDRKADAAYTAMASRIEEARIACIDSYFLEKTGKLPEERHKHLKPDIFSFSSFSRYATIELDRRPDSSDLTQRLKEDLRKEYRLIGEGNTILGPKVTLSNSMIVAFADIGIGYYIQMQMPPYFSREGYQDVKRFILTRDYVACRNPCFDISDHNQFGIRFDMDLVGKLHILEDMLGPDIETLKAEGK